MIDKIVGFVTYSINWWHNFLGPLCAPTPIFSITAIVGVIALFFILRWQQRHWGNMWAGEGVLEFFGAGVISVLVTAAFYMLPFLLFCAVVSVVAFALLAILTMLVKVSLGEY